MNAENTELPIDATVDVSSTTNCACCEAKCNSDDSFCESCGYPVNGTIEERDQFMNNRNYNLYELSLFQKKIRSARNTLYVLASLFVLSGIFFYSTSEEYANPLALLITFLVIAGIYVGLAVWTKKQPLPAIVSGLLLFVILQLVSVIEDPSYLFKGIIIKIVVVVYLVKGIRAATGARDLVKAHNLF
jgi:hypothetical protein